MQALDTFALSLPSKHVLPEALACAHQAIHSPEVHVRHAACAIVLVIVEGCADTIRARLPAVLQACGPPSFTHLSHTDAQAARISFCRQERAEAMFSHMCGLPALCMTLVATLI